MLPTSISIMLVSRLSGRLSDRYGPFWPMAFGISCIGLSMAWLATAPSLQTYWSELFPITVLYGLGLGGLIAPLTAVAMNSLPVRFSGVASGVNNSAARIATMVAVALMGSLMVILFEPTLQNALVSLDLHPSVQNQLLAQASLLGNIDTSMIENSQTRLQLQGLISDSIADTFSRIMWFCALVSVLSLVLISYYHWRNPSQRASFWPADN